MTSGRSLRVVVREAPVLPQQDVAVREQSGHRLGIALVLELDKLTQGVADPVFRSLRQDQAGTCHRYHHVET